MTNDDPRNEHDQDASDGPRGDDIDELASALLDGELDAVTAATVRQRPDVVARATELAAVRDSVRASSSVVDGAPDPEARERAITAALAAFDDEGRRATRAAVTHLDVRRAVRREATRRWLGAAAAVALVGAGIAGLAIAGTAGDSGSDDSAASSAAEDAGGSADETAGSGTEGGPPASGEDQAEGGGGESATSQELGAGTDGVVDLGAFDSADALVADVNDRLAGGEGADDREDAAESPAPSTAPDAAVADGAVLAARCPGGVPAALADADTTIVLRGQATVDDTDVEVWVVDAAGTRRLVAIDAACAVVVDRRLT